MDERNRQWPFASIQVRISQFLQPSKDFIGGVTRILPVSSRHSPHVAVGGTATESVLYRRRADKLDVAEIARPHAVSNYGSVEIPDLTCQIGNSQLF